MTLEEARPLLAAQARFGGAYNRQSAGLIIESLRREHGERTVDGLVRDLKLDEIFGLAARGTSEDS